MRKIIFIALFSFITLIGNAQTWYNSTAYQAAAVVYPSTTTLLGYTGYNSSGATVFIQIFNANTIPSNGAVPLVILTVPANTNFYWNAGKNALPCPNGIVIATSTTGPTLTLATATTWFNVLYQ